MNISLDFSVSEYTILSFLLNRVDIFIIYSYTPFFFFCFSNIFLIYFFIFPYFYYLFFFFPFLLSFVILYLLFCHLYLLYTYCLIIIYTIFFRSFLSEASISFFFEVIKLHTFYTRESENFCNILICVSLQHVYHMWPKVDKLWLLV